MDAIIYIIVFRGLNSQDLRQDKTQSSSDFLVCLFAPERKRSYFPETKSYS